MREIPISNFVRKYYEEKGRTFTDSEKATIFWLSYLSRDEIFEALEEIADTTADEKLKKQIIERLDYEREAEKMFRTPEEFCIYVFASDNPHEWGGECYFAEVEPAVEYGRYNCDNGFTITKCRLADKCGNYTPEDGGSSYCSQYYFSKDGKVEGFEESLEYISRFEEEHGGRFETQFLMLESPFISGDIVYSEGNDRPGVVQLADGHSKLLERVKNGTIPPPDYWDISNNVSFLWENGEFVHGHPNFLYLEKIDRWYDEYEWKVLQTVSDLMKGVGEMDSFFTSYEENIQDKREKGKRNEKD